MTFEIVNILIERGLLATSKSASTDKSIVTSGRSDLIHNTNRFLYLFHGSTVCDFSKGQTGDITGQLLLVLLPCRLMLSLEVIHRAHWDTTLTLRTWRD